MSDGKNSTAVRAKVAEIDARLQQMEESSKQLERLRNDPEVRRRLAEYKRDYGEGDPSWWRPEFELSEAVPSERVEYAVSAAPKPFVELSDTVASVVIRSSEKELEQLSDETGIALADFEALKDDTSRNHHIAFRITRKLRAIDRACEQYGLARDEFEELPKGPADRTAQTIVGRRAGAVAKKLHAAPQTQTDEPSPDSPPTRGRRGLLWAVLLGVVALAVLVVVLSDDEKPRPQDDAEQPTSAATPSTTEQNPAPPASTPPTTSSVPTAATSTSGPATPPHPTPPVIPQPPTESSAPPSPPSRSARRIIPFH